MGKAKEQESEDPDEATPPPDEWEGTLVVTPYASYDGALSLRRPGDEIASVVVPLPPALALVLFILKNAWDDDVKAGQRPPDRLGFRATATIAAAKQRLDSKVERGNIKVCVGRLRQAIRKAWAAAGLPGQPPGVIQTRRHLGYRLGLPLDLEVDIPGKRDVQGGET